jgi:RNA polymerase sigma-54 factor
VVGESSDLGADIIVRVIDGEHVVTLNEDGLRLRVADGLVETFPPPDDEARSYVEAKRHAAASLIAAVVAWRGALRDLARAVVHAQRDFIDGRSKYPRPLSLREVAGQIDMSVSTLTRVVAGKFIETPQGLFDLTYFFDLRTGSW